MLPVESNGRNENSHCIPLCITDSHLHSTVFGKAKRVRIAVTVLYCDLCATTLRALTDYSVNRDHTPSTLDAMTVDRQGTSTAAVMITFPEI